MIRPLFCLLSTCFLWMNGLFAQSDSLKRFYRVNYDIGKEEMDKEHIPLNGNDVSMIPFRVNNLYGFVANNKEQEWLIQPEFEKVHAVYKEGAIVKKGYGYGLVAAKGEVLVPTYYPNFRKEQTIFHGYFHAQDTLLEAPYNSFIFNDYFDSEGKLLFFEKSHDQETFNPVDTLAWFRYGSIFTIRGISGKVWQQIKYKKEKEFIGITNNLMLYRLESEKKISYEAYDIHGELKFKLPYDEYFSAVIQLNTDLFMFTEDGFGYGFCDAQGEHKEYVYMSKLLKPVQYFDGFYKKYFPIEDQAKGLMSLIDNQGQVIMDFKYSDIGEVVDEQFFCFEKESSEWASVWNTKGEKLHERIWFGYEGARLYRLLLNTPLAFNEGLFRQKSYRVGKALSNKGEWFEVVSEEEDYQFIDIHGAVQIKLDSSFRFAGVFKEGLAPVIVQGKGLGFINKKGTIAIQPEYQITSISGEFFSIYIIPEFKGDYAYITALEGYIDKNGNEFFKEDNNYALSGHWKEVRKVATKIGVGIPMPNLEFQFFSSGKVKLREYDNPNSLFINGKFSLKDSLLILNPKADDYPFDAYFFEDELIIEKYTDKELVFVTNKHPNLNNIRYHFLSNEFFNSLSKEEIRTRYTHTAGDTLRKIELNKEKKALEELRKNDRSVAGFPGGYYAMEKFINDNLNYPEGHTEGVGVALEMEVDTDGTLLNIRLERGEADQYSKEAIRLVKSMPNWLPKRFDGVPRKTNANIFILFKRSE